MDYLIQNPYLKFKVKKQEPKREYLTLHELKKIKNKEIDFQRLNIVRDIFVSSIWAGIFRYCKAGGTSSSLGQRQGKMDNYRPHKN